MLIKDYILYVKIYYLQLIRFSFIFQKFYLVLGLLCIGVKGENKINLEDIERDNLRVEGISKSGIARVEEAKYPTKPEIGQQQYQIPYRGPTSAPVAYVTPSSAQNVKRIFLWRQISQLTYVLTCTIICICPASFERVRCKGASISAAK